MPAAVKTAGGYNPFADIRDRISRGMKVDEAISSTAHSMVMSVSGSDRSDPFMLAGAEQLATAILGYVWYREPKENHNMNRVVEMLTMMKVDENNPNAKSKLDLMFDGYGEEEPGAYAVKAYNLYRIPAPRTRETLRVMFSAAIWSKTNALSAD